MMKQLAGYLWLLCLAVTVLCCAGCGPDPVSLPVGPGPVAHTPTLSPQQQAATAVDDLYQTEKEGDWAAFSKQLAASYLAILAVDYQVDAAMIRDTIFPGMLAAQHENRSLQSWDILEQQSAGDQYIFFVNLSYLENDETVQDAHYLWAIPEQGGWRISFEGEFVIPPAARTCANTYLDHFVHGRSQDMFDMLAPGYVLQVLETGNLDREEYYKDFDLFVRRAINLKENLVYELQSARCRQPGRVVFSVRIQYTKLDKETDVIEEYEFIKAGDQWFAVLPLE